MHRTQLSFEQWQYESLKAQAEKEGRSMSDLVREAVAVYLVTDSRSGHSALSAIEGLGDDDGGRGREHDRLLYGAAPEGRED